MKVVAMVKVVEDYTVNAFFVTVNGKSHRVSMFDDLIGFLSEMFSFNGVEYIGSRKAYTSDDRIEYVARLERHDY